MENWMATNNKKPKEDNRGNEIKAHELLVICDGDPDASMRPHLILKRFCKREMEYWVKGQIVSCNL
jgi:hypothetical protein